MYVLYALDINRGNVVVLDSNLNKYIGLSMDMFIDWLDSVDCLVVGVDDNNSDYCLLEKSQVGVDLCGNYISYISLLSADYEKRFKFNKDGSLAIKFSESEVVKVDLNIESAENLLGIYYVLNTVVGDIFNGLIFITMEDNIMYQYSYINGRLRLDANVSVDNCSMNLDTERITFIKGGLFND